MNDERLDVLLLELRDAAADLELILAGKARASLDTELVTERAVSMTLIIVCELANRIAMRAPELVGSHPHVPWDQIRGFRNRLVHNYFEVNRDIVWVTATESVPALVDALSELVPPHSAS